MICGPALNASSQTITTTLTNGALFKANDSEGWFYVYFYPFPSNSVTFKGRVLDDATGKPIAGARVISTDYALQNGATLKGEMFDPKTGKKVNEIRVYQTRRTEVSTDLRIASNNRTRLDGNPRDQSRGAMVHVGRDK